MAIPDQSRYDITDEVLGRGKIGNVVVVKDWAIKKEYAMKIVKNYSKNREHVQKEIKILETLKSSEYIVQIVDHFERRGHYHIVLEKMSGGSLSQKLKRMGRLQEEDAVLVVRDVTLGLEFLHYKGIAHRDMKPGNILCTYEDRASPVKICDFHLASINEQMIGTVGTPRYVAPEILRLKRGQGSHYDRRCDLWSLAVMTYYILSGIFPFKGDCGQNCGAKRKQKCLNCRKLLFEDVLRGKYQFPKNDWNNVSKNAQSFVKCILVVDPTHRYTAEEILRHPWLTGSPPKPAVSIRSRCRELCLC